MEEAEILELLKAASVKVEPGERWAKVADLPHAVSSHGRVFALPTKITVNRRNGAYVTPRGGKLMSPFIADDGMRVNMGARRTGGPHYVGTVARLVLQAFVGAPPPDACQLVVIHLDGNPYNDHVENLRWGTRGLSERIATAKKMIEVGLAGGTLDLAAAKTGISLHHSMEMSRMLRGAVGARKFQPWPEVARMLDEQKPDLSVVLRSRSSVYRDDERAKRKGPLAQVAAA